MTLWMRFSSSFNPRARKGDPAGHFAKRPTARGLQVIRGIHEIAPERPSHALDLRAEEELLINFSRCASCDFGTNPSNSDLLIDEPHRQKGLSKCSPYSFRVQGHFQQAGNSNQRPGNSVDLPAFG